ncbi:MAG: hypothetical protein AAF721_28345 [Myxococcota bacterium]
MMLSYEQTSTEPFVLAAQGSSPVGIARLIAIVGVAMLALGLLFIAADGDAAEGTLVGVGLMVLGGTTALAGLFRLGAEHAARFMVLTQPRTLCVIKTDGPLRVEADRRLILASDVERIEVQRTTVPPAFSYNQPEDRYFVAVVADSGLVEMQLDSASEATHFAKVIAHRLGVSVSGRDRPMLPQAVGLGGAYLILALFAMVGLAFWSLTDLGSALVAAIAVAGLASLQYPIALMTTRGTVRRWLAQTYGVAS